MKTLQQLLVQLKPLQIAGSLELSIGAIEIDSRKVKAGTAFIAITGVQTDGHAFINKAIELGAVAIVCETMPAELVAGITYVKVANTQEATARMAVEFYNHPSTQLKLVGVTGTNGKTTIATFCLNYFVSLGINLV
jgi:UDP-N-acetylmuramoyl-L-alanyl-D-glutamate--2,6-diaminopimelate ligase